MPRAFCCARTGYNPCEGRDVTGLQRSPDAVNRPGVAVEVFGEVALDSLFLFRIFLWLAALDAKLLVNELANHWSGWLDAFLLTVGGDLFGHALNVAPVQFLVVSWLPVSGFILWGEPPKLQNRLLGPSRLFVGRLVHRSGRRSARKPGPNLRAGDQIESLGSLNSKFLTNPVPQIALPACEAVFLVKSSSLISFRANPVRTNAS